MSSVVKIVLLGDVIGRPGRRVLRALLPKFRKKHSVDMVIANGENASGGLGIKENAYKDLLASGVDVLTSGNHIWNKKEIWSLIERRSDTLLRPSNYPETLPGKGATIFTLKNKDLKIGVINMLGRVFMQPIDSPFTSVKSDVENILLNGVDIIVVDFHAEATAEKEAMAFYLKNKVSFLAGTHTHVQTSDEKIFPEGMGYITDLGRCGSFFSVLGVKYEESLRGFLTSIPQAFTPHKQSLCMEGVIISCDAESGKCVHVERIREFLEE